MPLPPDKAAQIRVGLDVGTLPRAVKDKRLSRFGSGRACSGCDGVIHPSQIEYEYTTCEEQTVQLHLGCAGLWEAERRRRGWSGPTAPMLDLRAKALAALEADRGTWHCLRCWAKFDQ